MLIRPFTKSQWVDAAFVAFWALMLIGPAIELLRGDQRGYLNDHASMLTLSVACMILSLSQLFEKRAVRYAFMAASLVLMAMFFWRYV
jgi:uncharacterized membrane protein